MVLKVLGFIYSFHVSRDCVIFNILTCFEVYVHVIYLRNTLHFQRTVMAMRKKGKKVGN